jgi:hypothetical protein
MNYIKSNAMPLLIGAALGYFLAKQGGLRSAASKVTSTVKSAA